MMNKRKKLSTIKTWLVAILSLVLVLSGCRLVPKTPAEDSESVSDSESSTEGTPDALENLISFVENGSAKVIIISNGSEYNDCAKSLQTLLSGKLGINIPMRNYELDTDVGMKIYVGGNYNEIANPEPPALYDAYGSYYKDGNFYLLGDTPTTVTRCVNDFSSRISLDSITTDENGKSNCKVLLEKLIFLKNPEVKFTSPRLLGDAVHEYRIVIPKAADAFTRYLAKSWKEGILSDTGYVVEIVTDDTAPTTHEIVLGKTSRTGNHAFYSSEKEFGSYEIKSVDKVLYVSYSDEFALTDVDPLFRRELYANDSPATISENGKVTLGFSLKKSNEDDVRVMTSNVLVAGWGGDTDTPDVVNLRMELMAEMYNAVLPDFIGLQECDSANRSYMKEYLDDCFSWVNFPSNAASKYMTVIYRSDVWQLLECGTGVEKPEKHPWGFVWARFQQIDDPSKTFIVFSTHWAASDLAYPGFRMDIATELNAKLKEFASLYPDTPVAVTGDQNGGRNNDAFNAMVKDLSMETSYIASNDSDVKSSIDHVVINTDLTEAVYYRTVRYFSMDFASDHFSYFADLRLK